MKGFIKFKVEVDLDEAYDIIELVLKGDSPATPHVQLAIEDSYKRLLILLFQTKLYRKRKPRLMPIRFKVLLLISKLLLAPPLERNEF
jgi:uncharacterized protein